MHKRRPADVGRYRLPIVSGAQQAAASDSGTAALAAEQGLVSTITGWWLVSGSALRRVTHARPECGSVRSEVNQATAGPGNVIVA
jgi:hypothetical protein